MMIQDEKVEIIEDEKQKKLKKIKKVKSPKVEMPKHEVQKDENIENISETSIENPVVEEPLKEETKDIETGTETDAKIEIEPAPEIEEKTDSAKENTEEIVSQEVSKVEDISTVKEVEKVKEEPIKTDIAKIGPQNIEPVKTEKVKTKKPKEPTSKKQLYVVLAIFIAALLLILFLIFGIFTLYNLSQGEVISKGISIYGMDVSGLTKTEALSKISSKFEEIQNTDIKLVADNFESAIHPSEIDLKFNLVAAINYAYSIGKTGNILSDDYEIFSTMVNGTDIIPDYSFSEESLNSVLNSASKNLPNPVVESSYYIEDSKLVITKGTKGDAIDTIETVATIKEKLSDLSYLSGPVNLTLKVQDPKDVDMVAIYKEVHKNPVNAYYTTNPYAVYPSENGVDFKISLNEAIEGVKKAKKEYTVPLKTLYPKVTTNQLGKEAFPNLLAEFTTTYSTAKTNRSTNLYLAAKKINGTVLLPGDNFSYNKVVGERTIAAGFKEAGIYVNGELVDGLGGGVCQISSTVFNAVMLANLKITEVYYHPYVSSYVSIGRDATVAYGSKDFKFKNSRKYAIKIECTASGGVARCKIYGFKEDPEYDVKISVVTNSRTSTYTNTSTYRILYLNGKKVSSERIYSCSYKKH